MPVVWKVHTSGVLDMPGGSQPTGVTVFDFDTGVTPGSTTEGVPAVASTASDTLSLQCGVQGHTPAALPATRPCAALFRLPAVSTCLAACASQHLFEAASLLRPIICAQVGSVNNTFGIPGVAQYCNFFKSIEDANSLRRRVSECFERASLPATPEAVSPGLTPMTPSLVRNRCWLASTRLCAGVLCLVWCQMPIPVAVGGMSLGHSLSSSHTLA